MMAALDAAASSGALTVSIGAMSDTNGDGVTNADDPVRPDTTTAISGSGGSATGPKFTLYFSDDVAVDVAKLQDIIEVNGVPAVVAHAAQSRAGGQCDNRRVDITLGQSLADKDVISIAESSFALGTKDDKRPVPTASATVTAAAPDRTRPAVSVLGIADGTVTGRDTTFTVTFSDAGGFAVTTADSVTTAHVSVVKASGSADVTVTGVASTAVTAAYVTDGENKSITATVTVSRDLVAGDRLTVRPAAVKDAAGNESAGTSGAAIKAQASPRITQVLMSSLKHSARAGWTVPAAVVGGATSDDAVKISAKAGGDADGAAGNGWSMTFDRASDYSTAKPLDIDVRVDTKNQRVTVRFNDGPATATIGDLLAALAANDEFDARFSAGFANCETGVATARLGLVAARNQAAAADNLGRSQFAIEVRFNAYVNTVGHDALLADVLANAVTRTKLSLADLRAAPEGAAGGTDAGGGLDLASPTAVTDGATTTVRYEGTTALVRNLPKDRDAVITQAGHTGAPAIDGPPAFAAITAVPAVATGYAADTPTAHATADGTAGAQDRVDEDKNAASQNRISVSASVKARK